MTALERLAIAVFVLVALMLGAGLELRHYGTQRYDAGYSAAVAAGKEQHDRDAAATRETESNLRAQLAAHDADAYRKEQEYASTLADAQRRVRAGTDRLRCPTAGAVQPTTAPGDRPATTGPATDGQGPAMVPDVSADILGLVADHQRLVQRYQRVIERFEACRAVNAK